MDDTPHTNVERLLSVVAIQQEIATAKQELDAVMALVAERVLPLTGADGAAVELVEGNELVYRAVSGTLSAHLGTRLDTESSISGLCVRGGEILRSDDTETDERVDREITRQIGARSMIVVPLYHDRRTVGVLKVVSARPGAFGEEEVYTLQLMTGLIAAGMSHTAQFEAEQALLEERTQALEKLRNSEEHLRTIFEQSAVGIAETDLDGRFVLLNQRYCEITGYSREELLSRRMQDITHPDDLPENLRLLERLGAEGAEFEIEKRYVCKDGSTVWASNVVSPRWDGSEAPAYAVAVVEDITERKRADEVLRESEEKYRTLFDSIDEGFCIFELLYDEKGDAADYRFLEVNQVFERQTGLANAVGKLGSEIAPNTESYWLEAYDQVLRTGTSQRFENYHSTTERWYEAYASRVGGEGSRRVCTVFRDVTERKRHEERQAFLLRLGDALRPLDAPAEIQGEACRLVAEKLDVDRAYYVEVDEASAVARVERDYVRVGAPSLAGEHPVANFSWVIEILRHGKCHVVADTQTSDLVPPADRTASAALEIIACMGAPLIKQGVLVGALCVTNSRPREWFESEVELLREVGERIWAAAERARAEEALRQSERGFRAFVEASSDVVYKMSANWRELRSLDGKEFVADTDDPRSDWTEEYLPEDEKPRVWAAIEEAIQSRSNFELEHRVIRADGTTGWTHSRAVPMLDDAGGIVEWLGTASDITERKRAEEALRQSEESYRHLFEQSGELLLVHDGEGRIFDCNEQACAAHGYSCREMLSMSVSDLTDALLSKEEKRQREANGGTLWQRMLAGESARAEDTHVGENIRKDGTRFPVEVRVSGITYGGQSMILASLRDITERKRAEEELRDALRDARQYASQLQELREAGLMIGSKRSLEEVLQATTDLAREIVGAHQSVTSLTVDEDWSQSITSVSLSDKYADWRDYDDHPDGSGIYAEVCRTNLPMRMTREELEAHPAFKGFGEAAERHPPILGWLAAPLIGRDADNMGVIQLSDRYEGDFTGTDEAILVQLAQMASVALENARLYAESREAEFRYRSLVEGLDAIVWEAKAPDLAFSFVSRRAEDILGYPPEKWLAEPGFLLARIHPEDRRAAESFYEAAESGIEIQEPVEYRVRSAAGREVWLRDEVRVIRGEDGSLVRLTGLMVDVTEIKRAEQALLEIREAERRRIARDLHDSVLQDISGALQNMQALQAERRSRGDDGEDELEQSLGALRQAVGGLREAIYDLRRDDERPLIHEVEALVELNRQMAPECDLTLHVEREFPREPPEAVSRELLRIIHEGLVNIRRHSGARRANVTLGAEGGEVWAGIFDDGRGFDQAGTPEGMGLSGMRERVAAMGGKLLVRSEPNRGTSVTMTIPLYRS